MESIPARSAFLMPAFPIACVATRRPALCASWATTSSSSGSSAVCVGVTPGVRTPPVAITLMKWAPSLISVRVARRIASGPSASRPMKCPWPPVMVMTRPATFIRGPGMNPCSIALASSMAMPLAAPQSRTVVPPDSSVSRAPRAPRSVAIGMLSSRTWAKRSAAPSLHRWTWQLMRPGSSVWPVPSTTAWSATAGAWPVEPTHAMRRPSTTTAWSATGTRPVPSNSVTFRIMKLVVLIPSPSSSPVVVGPSSQRRTCLQCGDEVDDVAEVEVVLLREGHVPAVLEDDMGGVEQRLGDDHRLADRGHPVVPAGQHERGRSDRGQLVTYVETRDLGRHHVVRHVDPSAHPVQHLVERLGVGVVEVERQANPPPLVELLLRADPTLEERGQDLFLLRRGHPVGHLLGLVPELRARRGRRQHKSAYGVGVPDRADLRDHAAERVAQHHDRAETQVTAQPLDVVGHLLDRVCALVGVVGAPVPAVVDVDELGVLRKRRQPRLEVGVVAARSAVQH